MKTILIVLSFLLSVVASAQTVAEINLVLGIPDSLENSNEIRIYKRYEITYSTEIFRMYRVGKDYKAELYHFHNDTKKFEKTKLKANSGEELAWMKIMITNIDHLPKWETFQYKLENLEIVFDHGQYSYGTTTMAISDGVGYDVYLRTGKNTNHIEYGNPESYLKSHPGVDELEMFSKMLNTVREEFDIWKDGR